MQAVSSVPLALWKTAQHHRRLLDSARDWADKGNFDIAMIVAQSSIEVLTAQVIDDLCAMRNLEWLDKPVILGRTYDLTNDRVREIYSGLSGDRIQDHQVWETYRRLVQKRHEIVHQGTSANEADAREFLQAITELMVHLESVASGR